MLYLTDLKPGDKFGSLEEMILGVSTAFAARGGLFLPVFGGPLTLAMVEQYQEAGLPIEWLNLERFRPFCLSRLRDPIRRHRAFPESAAWRATSPSTARAPVAREGARG